MLLPPFWSLKWQAVQRFHDWVETEAKRLNACFPIPFLFHFFRFEESGAKDALHSSLLSPRLGATRALTDVLSLSV